MRQESLADGGFEKFRKNTRKEQFLDKAEAILLWKALTQPIEPSSPKRKGAGCCRVGAVRMLQDTSTREWSGVTKSGPVSCLRACKPGEEC